MNGLMWWIISRCRRLEEIGEISSGFFIGMGKDCMDLEGMGLLCKAGRSAAARIRCASSR